MLYLKTHWNDADTIAITELGSSAVIHGKHSDLIEHMKQSDQLNFVESVGVITYEGGQRVMGASKDHEIISDTGAVLHSIASQ